MNKTAVCILMNMLNKR